MTRSRRTRSRRPGPMAAGVLAVLSLGLSGCAVFSQQTTELDYTPSDGAQVDVGQLQVRNLFFVAEDADSPANLVGVFLNAGTDDIDVTLTSDNGVDSDFTVPGGGSVSLGPDGDEEVEVDSVGTVPGRTTVVTVTSGSDGTSAPVPTPVLDGTLPDYADLVPTS